MAAVPGNGRGLLRTSGGGMLYEMPGRVSATTVELDPETIIWRNRVLAIGAGFLTNSVSICDGLIKAIKRNAWHTEIPYLAGYLGHGIGAACVPILDRLNAGPATNVNFVDADFSQQSGLQGSIGYLDTKVRPSQLSPDNTGGLFWWENNMQFTANSEAMGCHGADPVAPDRFVLDYRSNRRFFSWGQAGNAGGDTNGASNGFFLGQSDLAQRSLYYNDSLVGTNTTPDLASLSSAQTILLCGCYTYSFAGGYVAAPWPGRSAVAGMTTGKLTLDQITQLRKILRDQLMTPTGRPLA